MADQRGEPFTSVHARPSAYRPDRPPAGTPCLFCGTTSGVRTHGLVFAGVRVHEEETGRVLSHVVETKTTIRYRFGFHTCDECFARLEGRCKRRGRVLFLCQIAVSVAFTFAVAYLLGARWATGVEWAMTGLFSFLTLGASQAVLTRTPLRAWTLRWEVFGSFPPCCQERFRSAADFVSSRVSKGELCAVDVDLEPHSLKLTYHEELANTGDSGGKAVEDHVIDARISRPHGGERIGTRFASSRRLFATLVTWQRAGVSGVMIDWGKTDRALVSVITWQLDSAGVEFRTTPKSPESL